MIRLASNYRSPHYLNEIAELLISNNASLTAQDDFGGTALSYAAEHKQYKLIERLLEAGVRFNDLQRDLRHAILKNAQRENNEKLLNLLVR